MLDGGAEAARAGGCLIAGGHSIDDAEPKYGLAVVGVVDPDAVFTNAGAQSGDVLVLTKPIGLGVLSTAMKRDAATPAQVATAVDVMTALNAGARDAAVEVGVHAATDVTGFGLLGHLRELCVASGVSAQIDSAAVPVIDGVRDLLDVGMVAGGTQRNHAFVAPDVDFGSLPEREQLLARRRPNFRRVVALRRRRASGPARRGVPSAGNARGERDRRHNCRRAGEHHCSAERKVNDDVGNQASVG